MGSLQRLEEISKFIFKEYIVDKKNIHNLDLPKCYVKLRFFEKNIKNFIDVFDQSAYKGVLSGLIESLHTNDYVIFEVRVFLFNMTRDDQSKMSRMTRNSRQSNR